MTSSEIITNMFNAYHQLKQPKKECNASFADRAWLTLAFIMVVCAVLHPQAIIIIIKFSIIWY